MPTFADSLQEYRLGKVTKEDLYARADTDVRLRGEDPVALLAALYDYQATHPDETSQFEAVEQHILKYMRRQDHKKLGDTIVIDEGAPAVPTAIEIIKTPPSPKVVAAAQLIAGTEAANEANASSGGGTSFPPGVGSTLKHRFKLVERIGRGGMSSVFKAIDLRKVEAHSGDPFIAVKVLNPPFNDEGRALLLLQGEAAKLQTLAHPNIVRVSDCDRDGRSVFMTMEFLEGESLERRLARAEGQPLPVEEAKRIIAGIASALAEAHSQSIVHGDLKPANVIVTNRGEVKVIDFGIARLLSREFEHPTLRAVISGLTPAYASPEMLEKADPDPRDDIYALSCIAHEILTGEHPYGRTDAVDARDAGLKLIRNPNLSRRQYRAIAHGLAFERTARTPRATQFLEEMRDNSAGRVLRFAAFACLLLVAIAVGIGLYDWVQRLTPGVTTTAPVTASVAPGEVFRDCPTCPLLRAVPGGTFEQGSSDDDPGTMPAEKPRHPVTIPATFGMGVYEITVAEYKEFVDATNRTGDGCEVYDGAWQMRADRSWLTPGFEQTAAHPVVCVSWNDAKDYVSWLSARTHYRYRLPSASEWEYAARAGTDGAVPWNADAAACEHGNVADQTAVAQFPGWKAEDCADKHVFTASVGSFAPNAFGLFDVIGNAFEWVQDCWHDDYQGAPTDGTSWSAEQCAEHEIRGGSWFSGPELARSAYRNRFDADHRANSVGFRVLREIGP